MEAFLNVFRNEIHDIVNIHVYNQTWIISQVFAFFALITMFWSFQIKDKLKMMLLLGMGTTFLAVSAAFLNNWTLTILFAIASVRNYVFCFFEWRKLKERPVARWWWWFFAGVFISATVGSTVILVYFGHLIEAFNCGNCAYDLYCSNPNIHEYGVKRHSDWLEWSICLTLIGLIIGNVIKGTDLMRISFVANRTFNIINHWHFSNIIAVFIACMTISSNIIFYIRQLVSWQKKRKAMKSEHKTEEESELQPTAQAEE